jgi:hypothetical protein
LAVEPPLRVEHREELVWLLAQACELEHGLMCEYLFAQFTLKCSADEGLSVEQLAKVAAWEQVLVEVTKQEMLHLALATNLLTAIGAAPHLYRPNFPILSRWYPQACRSRCSGSASGPCATSSTWSVPRGWSWTTPKASRPGPFALVRRPASLRRSPPDRLIARRWASFVGPLRAKSWRADDQPALRAGRAIARISENQSSAAPPFPHSGNGMSFLRRSSRRRRAPPRFATQPADRSLGAGQVMNGRSSAGMMTMGRIMSRSSCSRMWQWYM